MQYEPRACIDAAALFLQAGQAVNGYDSLYIKSEILIESPLLILDNLRITFVTKADRTNL
jgi:hypothetical protein